MRGKERTRDESKRTRGKLRKARRGERQYKACRKETRQMRSKVAKEWEESRSTKNAHWCYSTDLRARSCTPFRRAG